MFSLSNKFNCKSKYTFKKKNKNKKIKNLRNIISISESFSLDKIVNQNSFNSMLKVKTSYIMLKLVKC